MNTAETLLGYYDFDEAIIERVAEVAEYQNSQSFEKLTAEYGVADGAQKVPIGDGYLEILEFVPHPDEETDPAYARVYNLSMGNSIMPALTMNLMTLFAADPSSRLIMIGNPSVPGHAGGTVSRHETREMRREHTLRPVAEPVLHYLGRRGITTSAELGYSYGADKAAAVAGLAPDFDHQVTRGVFVEPPSLITQRRTQMAAAFMTTARVQPKYIKDTECEPYIELRKKELPETNLEQIAALGRGLPYLAGLLRVTNRAIWSVLAQGGYENRLQEAVEANPDGRFTTAWGTLSELVDDAKMLQAVMDFRSDHPLGDHTSYIRLRGAHHAGGDNIYLHTATMLQGLNA
jgi:hypothetical protein